VADPTRVAVVGLSVGRTCGVRDHAELLAGALQGDGIACSTHWLTRERGTLRAANAEVRGWTGGLAEEIERGGAEAILLHYSVFSYSHRGVPLFVAPVMAALRRTRLPMVAFMHELAFPLGKEGVRGRVWALTQRAALFEVVRASASIALTADFRVSWLQSRRWLAKRPVALAPVFSNLPVAALDARPTRDFQLLGLFGYRYDEAAIARVLDALALLRAGSDVRLRLLGGPGVASGSGARWLAATQERGLSDAVSFSEVLPAQELADELCACDVLIFADTPGPSSRKGTLAGSLASGRPLVATEGHRGWPELMRQSAALVVTRSAPALAGAVAGLLSDESEREALGARGRAFAASEMGLSRSADVLAALLAKAIAGEGRGSS
jgi:hypothetical protein